MRKDVHVTAGMNEREDGESEGRRGPKKRGGEEEGCSLVKSSLNT